MDGIKRIGGDDIEMPKRSREDSALFCMLFIEKIKLRLSFKNDFLKITVPSDSSSSTVLEDR